MSGIQAKLVDLRKMLGKVGSNVASTQIGYLFSRQRSNLEVRCGTLCPWAVRSEQNDVFLETGGLMVQP